jgi:tetratricopeptide (TPR) repeat protein
MRARHAILALLAAGALTLSAPARAQTAEEIKLARQTAGEAFTAYQNGEFEKALGLFKQAKTIYPGAQVLRMLGYSELALKNWVNALEALEASLDAKIAPLSKDDRKDVQENINAALVHIGTVTVTSKVPGALLAVDGAETHPLPLDKPLRLPEGPHKLVVTAPDHLDATSDLKIEGGKSAEVTLEPALKPKPKLPPPPPPPPPPKPTRKEWVPNQRLVGLGAIGGGVLFGGATLITALEGLHWHSLAKSDFDAHVKKYGQGCAMGDPRLCSYDITVTNREADTANKLRSAGLGLGVTAGVLGATGLVFFLAAPKKQPPPPAEPPPAQAQPAMSLACTPGGLGVSCSGTF